MRRRRLSDSERISLFPFLAVLICTMGALLVLLVVIAQRVQANAQAEKQANTAEIVRAHREKVGHLQQLELQLQQLQQARDVTATQLGRRRDALAHVEDHMRRLRDELAALQQSAQQLTQSSGEDTSRLQNIRDELARITAQITESEQLLAETRKRLENRQASYAVVPYDGQHGTRRRPIYLDCREDTIVLQPEGIKLTEHDFRTPLGPDNPLASVLRVSSEYLNSGGNGEQGRPYPLLLVRPVGIRAYYAARAALKSWDAEFGYELIGDDWEIEYPAADPQLAQVAGQELMLARKRHEMYVLREQAGRGSGRGGSRRGGSRGGSYTGGSEGGGGTGDRDGGSGTSGGFAGPASDGGNAPSGGHAAQPPEGSPADLPSSGPSPHGQLAPTDQHTQFGQSNQAASSDAGGGQAAVTASATNSLADARGRDWALPDASRSAVPFTRPVRVEVHTDKIVIVPRDSNDQWKVIAANGATQTVIEEFVSAIWDHMKGWGIAGRGMYWKPILNLYVAPGAEQRAADMEVLLERSGLEINRPKP